MSDHRFRVGERVRLSASAVTRGIAGTYEVVAHLPEERGDRQYRLKNPETSQQRVAWESQLAGLPA